MRRKLLKKIVGFVFLIFTSNIYAQEFWQKLSDFDNANSISTLAEGANQTVYGRTVDGWIYSLPNNSQEWIPFVNIPDGANVNRIKASSTTGRVYATTGTWGLLYTDNFGTNWGLQNFGLNSPDTGLVPGISHLEAFESKLFVCFTGFNSQGSVETKMFYSANGAVNYQAIGTLNTFIFDSRFTGNNTAVVVGTDDGVYYNASVTSSQWNNIGFPGQSVSQIEFKNNKLFVTVFDSPQIRIYTSSNLGESWTELNDVPFAQSAWELKYASETESLFLVSEQGVFKYQNDHWSQISEDTGFEALALGGNQKVIYSGSQILGAKQYDSASNTSLNLTAGLRLDISDAVLTVDNQLYISSNYSNILSQLNLNNLNWQSRVVPENENSYTIIHTMEKSNDGQALIGMNGFLLKTRDSGNQIEIIGNNATAPNDPIYGIFNAAQVSSNDQAIYVKQHSIQSTLHYTTDNGASWDVADPMTGGYQFLLLDQITAKGPSLYILGRPLTSPQNILIRTQDNGLSWNEFPNPNAEIRKVFADNLGNPCVYVNSDKLLRWDESSQSWEDLGLNLGNNLNKYLEVVFDNNNRLYVLFSGTLSPLANEGIYAQNDNGTFDFIAFPIVEGVQIPMKNLNFNFQNIPIAITNSTNGNSGSGIYFYSDEGFLSAHEEEWNVTNLNIYPNPTKDFLHIHTPSVVRKTEVFDLSGRLIFQSDYKIQIDVRAFPAGTYLIRIAFDSGKVLTKRFMIKK